MLKQKSRRGRFRGLKSGKVGHFSSSYKADRYVWIAVRPVGGATISAVRYSCWRAKNTLYGHLPGEFDFCGAKLRYRLMPPRRYDPRKKYPLVLSVHGSGGVGVDNVRSMEMVILARNLFTQYYNTGKFACFSLVAQIPPHRQAPRPYWPNPGATRGRPEPPYHPDWPAVNETSWYTEATLALTRA